MSCSAIAISVRPWPMTVSTFVKKLLPEMLFHQRGIPDMHLDAPSNFAISGVFCTWSDCRWGSGCRGEHRRDKPGTKTHHSMLPAMADLSTFANSGSIILDDMKDSQMVAYR